MGAGDPRGVDVSYHYGLQWCTIPGCPCGIPGRPCAQWEGYEKKHGRFDRKDIETWMFRYCGCCGFERQDHKSVIHNGRKPR